MKIIVVILLSLCEANAATWYASAVGNSTNGTSAEPWSLPYAVTNTNPHLHAGDTVLLKPGTFTCNETNATWEVGSVLEFRKSGTNTDQITYKAETLWEFTFDGGLLIPPTTSNIVIRNCRILQSNIADLDRNRTNVYEYPGGITTYGSNTAIMHNLIENCGHPGIASWKQTAGKYIAGNIIRFVGFNDWTTNVATGDGYNGAQRGSGMYLQNLDDSNEALIQGNISYYNYTTGMKAYGNTDIWKFTFRNQICAENNEAGLFYHLDNYGSTNLTMDANYLWQNVTGIRVGYPLGNSGHSNAIVSNNYVVDNGHSSFPFYMVDGWSNTTWTNNVGVSLADRYVWLLEVDGETNGNTASHTIDYNTYYATNTGDFGAGQFGIKEANYLFADWKTNVLGDSNSTFSYSMPADNSVYVFSPSTDTNFVHVAVFNWTNATTTTVDLSGYFPNGKKLYVYDAQNIPTAYTSFIYQGGSLALDLTLTNRATMAGTFSQRTDTWEGFDDRFRAFVIYSESVVAGTVNTMNVGTLILR